MKITALGAENALSRHLEEYSARAASVKEAHRRQADEIKRDTTLSEIGRRQRLADLGQATKQRLAGIRDEQDTYVAGLKRDLAAQLRDGQSADPAAVMSRRDAADRARGLTDEVEVEAMLREAIASGDNDYAVALGVHARRNGMVDAGNLFRAEFSTTADTLEAADYVEQVTSSGSFNLGRSMTYAAPVD